MSLSDKVDIYTQAMNAAFTNAYDAVVEPPDIAAALTEVPSKGRVENYPWIYPPPMMHTWKGYRQYAKLAETNYRVPNQTYSAEFEAKFEDLEDDQIDGFKRQAANLAKGAKKWKYIQVQQVLALGQTTTCFDGTNFFATSHTIGTGNNIVTGTAAATDGVTHAMIVLHCAGDMVKPLMWQNREAADFKTDAGSIEADKIRMVKWWTTLRGAAAFGFWWDAVLVKWANTPTVTEVQTTLGTVNARFRGFTYPKNLGTDPDQFPFADVSFSDKSLLTVCSTGIEHVVRQAYHLSLVGATENYWKGFSKLTASGYLNGIL